MPQSPQRWIVETDWLAGHLAPPDLVLLDGSMHLPTSGRNARKEFAAELGKLRKLAETDLPALEKLLDRFDAPVTPGRLPAWDGGK